MYSKYIDQKKKEKLTWTEITDIYNKENHADLSWNALRQRISYGPRKQKKPETKEEYETYFNDGTIEAQKVVNLPKDAKENPDKILTILGYNPNEWEIVFMKFSAWQQHTKMQETKELYAVQYKLRPKIKKIEEDIFAVLDEYIKKNIRPLDLPKKRKRTDNKVMVLPAVELHLGKEARKFDVGEDYNIDIAIERYKDILSDLIEHKTGNELIYGIGNDFINIDTPQSTTTSGTNQAGGISSYELFDIALELQTESLLLLREHFDSITLVLIKGNHSNTLEYTLFRAIEQRFKGDNIITIVKDYKDIQALRLGNTSIYMTHGDMNYKRTIENMSREFYNLYGATEHRYILLGHLHHKQRLEEANGFTVFRLSSPSGIDRWHYKERYLGKPGQEIFTFDKQLGLCNIKYINW